MVQIVPRTSKKYFTFALAHTGLQFHFILLKIY